MPEYFDETLENIFCKQILEFKNLKENSDRIIPIYETKESITSTIKEIVEVL